MLSAGCATYGLQLAAQAQGFDNVGFQGNGLMALHYEKRSDVVNKIV